MSWSKFLSYNFSLGLHMNSIKHIFSIRVEIHIGIPSRVSPFLFLSIEKKWEHRLPLLFCQPVAKVSSSRNRCTLFLFLLCCMLFPAYQRPLACPEDIRVPPYFLSAQISSATSLSCYRDPCAREGKNILFNFWSRSHLRVCKNLMERKHPIEMYIWK